MRIFDVCELTGSETKGQEGKDGEALIGGTGGLCNMDIFFNKHNINVDIHIRMSTHSYEHTYTHSISMSTFKRLN
jgi:hypothetical protein